MENMLAYYEIDNLLSDTFDQVGGIAFNPAVTGPQLVALLPAIFSIESDSNGENVLCCTKLVGQNMPIVVNSGTYTAKPIPFTMQPIIGPHPATVLRPGSHK